MKIHWKALAALLPVFRMQLKSMAVGTLLGVAAMVAAVGLFSLSGWFLSATAAAGLIAATAKDFNFFLPSIGVRILAVTRTLTRYGERLFCHDATFKILENLRVWFYRYLEPLSPAQLMSFGSGDMLSRIVGDIDALDNLYLRVFSPVFVAVAVTLILVGLFSGIDQMLALIAGTGLVAAGWVIPLMAVKMGKEAGEELVHLQSRLRSDMIQGVQGMAELLVFDIHTQYAANIMTNHDQLVERQRRMAHLSGLSSALLTLISGAVMMGILFVGVKLVGYKEITGEILTLVTLAVMAAFEAVWSLPAAFQYLNHTFTSAKRLLEIAATPPSVTFALCTAAPSKGFDLSLKQVFYKYSSTDPWVLENFSLSIPAGMHMAICGPSGAGKSTFAYLLMRFIDPQKGEILLGGENIRNFSESDLRNKLILITQKAHIFNGTIRTNLLLANPDANEEELWRALSAACLDVFVSELPEALDTWVGEGGRQLSGGQMQRLSLARAFLRDAPIWILDEPTEGLDRKTESALMDSLLKIAEKRTLIVVTHRRAVMRYFEHIVHIGP